MKTEEIKVGTRLLTWWDETVTVTEIRNDKDLKPLKVNNKGKTQYYHYNQITKILG
jgi:hypothetical protein